MNVFYDTKKDLHIPGWVAILHCRSSAILHCRSFAIAQTHSTGSLTQPLNNFPSKPKFDFLSPVRQLLDNIKINHPKFARFLCYLIPAQCPFERDINLFGRTLFHIPPMCKVNPLYEEFMMLRFRALSYLADECGEDVSRFC